tara:strand:- start:366 stop:965 length:600 start_codon:yes stop_codon:yes gene_type:complete
MNNSFWFNEPSILLRKDKVLQLWPYESMSFEDKLNAATRFVILISILGYMVLNNYLILLFGIVLILGLLLLYRGTKQSMIESFETQLHSDDDKFTKQNPLYNVLMSDYSGDVNKPALKAKYSKTQEAAINKSAKDFVLDNNKDNKEIGKIFTNHVNQVEFEQSMRQFHMNPSTSIPNTQDDFLKYCYGDLHTEKPLKIY